MVKYKGNYTISIRAPDCIQLWHKSAGYYQATMQE